MNLSQEELLKSVENSDSSNSVPEKSDESLHDLNRSIVRESSNITIVPQLLLSWHNVTAHVNQQRKNKFIDYFREPRKERCYTERSQKVLLDEVFGTANPGEVLAILGSSGAGKSTLLNVLTQRNLDFIRVSGDIRVNGLRVDKEYMKKVSAYVQQDDLFIGSLTVEEHLRFNAVLRMNDRYSDREQKRRVKQVVNDLGLKSCANSIIGTRTRKGISGGERKRLAFASEILTSPPMLLCDEPTSGLDSFLAHQVIQVLKKIYFMAEGRVVFCGTRDEAELMWTGLGLPTPLNFNPADHYISTLSIKKHGEAKQHERNMLMCEFYAKSDIGQKVRRVARRGSVSDLTNSSDSEEMYHRRHRQDSYHQVVYHASYFTQLKALTWRCAMNVLREPTLLKVQLTQSIILALITGLVYVNNSISQLQIFCLDFPTFYREHNSGLYRVSTYFLAKNIAEAPSYIISGILYSSILYVMSRLYLSWDAFLIYVLVAILVENVAISIGYMFSCLFGTVSVAVAVMPIFVVPMMAFGGFFINQGTLPLYFQPLKYLSYFGYGYETLIINQWSRINEIPDKRRHDAILSETPEFSRTPQTNHIDSPKFTLALDSASENGSSISSFG
ncbi:hypothetical protein WR25_12526 [Diploscapter pachys]|uniref:ABC transporter domain-containing protein n=1 Tax=Diploscapter pachys TaxID=2018661 RepID=A0A2A2JUU3_9BILA|nr:hypothetical protein WR25_12526 [Diploscapter pachys]